MKKTAGHSDKKEKIQARNVLFQLSSSFLFGEAPPGKLAEAFEYLRGKKMFTGTVEIG
jgi:hypothetical protein